MVVLEAVGVLLDGDGWDDAYHLIRLLGPDESHENVDDNVFSLEQSRVALAAAVRLVADLEEARELFVASATVDLLATSHAAPGGTFIGGIQPPPAARPGRWSSWASVGCTCATGGAPGDTVALRGAG